jgi:hypothetical protein
MASYFTTVTASKAGARSSSMVILWQGFDHPTSMFLPGVSIAVNKRDGAVKGMLFTLW